MYVNTGYLNQEETDLENMQVPLRINSSGVYRVISRPSMSTLRPKGRADYQLIYIASGSAWFTIGQEKVEVGEGNLVLPRPFVRQEYVYYGKDKPEAFWVHFTGSRAESLLEEAGFAQNQILYAGVFSEYRDLFFQMIRELQVFRPAYEDLLPLLLEQLLLLVRRHRMEGPGERHRIQKEMEKAIHYFNENYYRDIKIEDYARQQHMSTCWFIRSFKQYMNVPPLKYLTSVRIRRARELLETTDYTVSEIGALVGYENPLYFSRIFKKQTGVSPAGYRNAAGNVP